MKKVANFLQAVQRLREAVEEHLKHPNNDVIRDGMIPVSYTHLDVYKRQLQSPIKTTLWIRMQTTQSRKMYLWHQITPKAVSIRNLPLSISMENVVFLQTACPACHKASFFLSRQNAP